MAHFAEIKSEDNLVIRAVVISDQDCVSHGGENSAELEQWVASITRDCVILKQEFGGVYPNTYWKRTSYNTKKGVHYTEQNNTVVASDDQSKAFRLNYASDESLKYDSTLNGFVQANKPHDSWTLNTSTGFYDAPVADPSTMSHNGVLLNLKVWDEDNQRWTALDSATNINYHWIVTGKHHYETL